MGTGSELLEREAEAGRLADAVLEAGSGRGRVIVVSGPAGIGKTSLLDRAADLAADHALDVMRARGAELEVELPFALVRSLLSPALRLPARERAAVLDGAAALGGRVLDPAAEGGEPVADGAEGLAASLHGLHWLCANLADRRPLLLAVDDAHWADEYSLRFLAYLSRRVADLPVLLTIAARAGEPGAAAAFVERLADEAGAELLVPAPLSAPAAGRMLSDRLGADLDPAFEEACARVSGGNPFLLAELAEELRETGTEPTAGAVAQVAALGPRSVALGVLGRVGRLGPVATEVAHLVAVLGSGAELRRVAALVDVELDQAGAAVDALEAAHVLRPGRPLEFLHPMMRTAVYDDLPAARRAADHARAARLLSDEAAPVEDVATHLLAAEPAGAEWAVAALREAARHAQATGAPAAAARYLRRALAEPPAVSDRVAVTLELARAEAVAADPAADDHFAEALAAAGDPVARAELRFEQGRARLFAADAVGAAEALRSALAELDGADPELELRLIAELSSAIDMGAPDPPGFFDRLRELGDGLAGETTEERLVICAAVTWFPGTAERARRLIHRALADGELLRADPGSTAWSSAANQLGWAGDHEGAQREWDACVALEQERGAEGIFALASAARAFLGLDRGRLLAAEADARAAWEIVSRRGPEFLGHMFCRAAYVSVLAVRGQFEDAAAVLADGPEVAVRPESPPLDVLLAYARGDLALERREFPAAAADFAAVGDWVEAHLPRQYGMTEWRSDLAVALAGAGRGAEARTVAEEELARARAFGAPLPIGRALHALALADGAAGIPRLEEAERVLADAGADLHRARALVDLGSALRRANRRTDSRDPLRRGLDLAHRSGAATVEERAREELRIVGARPRRALLSGRDALTATELRVASLAAEGKTNREIAQSLFVTLKTVESHLAGAYRKLDVPGRAGLAEALAG